MVTLCSIMTHCITQCPDPGNSQLAFFLLSLAYLPEEHLVWDL